MFLAKQDLKSVPFQLLHEKATLAANAVEFNLIEVEKNHHAALITKKEREWSDTHEAPFEGNFEDIYPLTLPDPSVVEKAKKTARADAIKDQIEALGLKSKASWLLPQVTAYIAKMKLPEGDKISPFEFLRINFAVDDWHKGLYLYCIVAQRGLIVPSQSSPEYKNYSAIVPLLLMPFKKFNDTPYSRWDTKQLDLVVDPNLYTAMTFPTELTLSKEKLLEIRDKGLYITTGKGAGTSRNPVTYHNLYKIQGTEIAEFPWLCQVMATQIWSAHPANRTNLMILNWKDWDNMPEPLVDVTAGLPSLVSKNIAISSSALPW